MFKRTVDADGSACLKAVELQRKCNDARRSIVCDIIFLFELPDSPDGKSCLAPSKPSSKVVKSEAKAI